MISEYIKTINDKELAMGNISKTKPYLDNARNSQLKAAVVLLI
jgi:hypothetical protein